MNIQITGASGSGKTFLGKKLSEVLNFNFVDTDEILWVWDQNIQPYTIAVSDEDSCQRLKQELINNESTVASGMFYPWSESLINLFDLLIVLETDKEIRKTRIVNREFELYGERYKQGGDMFEQFNQFLNWAMEYDTSDDKLGSKKETDRWAKKFKCKVIYIDGNKEIDEKVNIILDEIKLLNYDKNKKGLKK